MTYPDRSGSQLTDPTIVNPLVDYHHQVRWGPKGSVNIPNQAPNVDPNQVRDRAGNTAKPAWSFLLGSLLGLAAAMIGAAVGARKPRVYA